MFSFHRVNQYFKVWLPLKEEFKKTFDVNLIFAKVEFHPSIKTWQDAIDHPELAILRKPDWWHVDDEEVCQMDISRTLAKLYVNFLIKEVRYKLFWISHQENAETSKGLEAKGRVEERWGTFQKALALAKIFGYKTFPPEHYLALAKSHNIGKLSVLLELQGKLASKQKQ